MDVWRKVRLHHGCISWWSLAGWIVKGTVTENGVLALSTCVRRPLVTMLMCTCTRDASRPSLDVPTRHERWTLALGCAAIGVLVIEVLGLLHVIHDI